MATTFDITKLDSTRYDWHQVHQVVKAVQAVEEFMEIVRNNPAYLQTNPNLIIAFCAFIDRNILFHNAMNVVLELGEPQDFDTSADTVMNTILRSCKHRRNYVSWFDPKHKEMVARSHLDGILFGIDARDHATKEQCENADKLFDKHFRDMCMFASSKTRRCLLIISSAGSDTDSIYIKSEALKKEFKAM